MTDKYAIGLDFGTNSVRCLIVRTCDGAEVGTAVSVYEHGEEGILLDPNDPNLARQHPKDYETGAIACVKEALVKAGGADGFSPDKIVGIGVDTTGSTPLPVDADGVPLAYQDRFANNLNAMAWLWKDHTSFAEAAAITERAEKEHPEYLAKCGGVYSSEWYFSKVWHCLKADPEVFEAAYTWVEMADWIPGFLVGDMKPENLKIGICAAGHKAMFNADWGGYPAKDFLAGLEPKLGKLREKLSDTAYSIDTTAGSLCKQWAEKLGLPEGLPVAVGAFDAHLGAVGSGIRPGVLVKILGTSSCDMMVAPPGESVPDIPGLCGIVKGSILPGCWGLEAGQSAAGDVFNWLVNEVRPGGPEKGSHAALTVEAEKLAPGQSGLLALDWNNGNRCVLVDPRVTGLLDRANPAYPTRRDLPSLDRSHGVRCAGDSGTLRGIRDRRRGDHQLRRNRGEEPTRDADLRRHHGSTAQDLAVRVDVCAGCGHVRSHRGGQGKRRVRQHCGSSRGDDGSEGRGLQSHPGKPEGVRPVVRSVQGPPRRFRNEGLEREPATYHERTSRHPRRSKGERVEHGRGWKPLRRKGIWTLSQSRVFCFRPKPINWRRKSMDHTEQLSRRDFLTKSAGIGAMSLAAPYFVSAETLGKEGKPAANDRIQLGFIGVGARGTSVLKEFLKESDMVVTAVSDVWKQKRDAAIELCGGTPKGYHDYRELLQDKNVDAVVIETPPHWHALQAIDACEAGKNFYIEKPFTMSIAETLAVRNAVRKHKRLTQVGTQIHAGANYHKVVDIIRSGILGKIGVVRTQNTMNQGIKGLGNPPDCDPPEDLDWNEWCGPARKRSFNPLIVAGAYEHQSFMDYSGGWTPGMAPHIIDLPFWALELGCPLSASASGGRYMIQDAGDCYDTHEVMWQYPNFTLTWRTSLVNSFGLAFPGDDEKRHTLAISFHGSNGTLLSDYGKHAFLPDGDNKLDASDVPKTVPDSPGHYREFLDCLRSGEQPSCNIDYHYKIDIAIRLSLISLELGRTVRFDPETETIPDDPEAAKLAKPTYRDPWKFPEEYL